MKSILLLFLSLLIYGVSLSQIVSGIISDEKGEVLPYATIFIRELNMGTTSNSEGIYQLNLNKGVYTIQFRSMGFEQKITTVNVGSFDIRQDIILQVQSIQLHEIRVYKDNVDPAYPIMRRAIAMAPYYQNQIKEYVADVYIKGNAKLESVPKLLQKKFNANVNGSDLKLGDVVVGESLSEIKFEAPDTYHQKIISSNMSGLSNQNATFDMGLITESPYQPVIGDNIITPLSPNSFLHYNFRYEGFYNEGEYLVNKIRILPKRKSKQLFSGYLYVVDGLWCLHGLELDLDQGMFDLHIDIQFAELDKGIFLPVSHAIKVKGKMLGIAGSAVYSSSVKYKSITKNNDLKLPALLNEFYEDKMVYNEIVSEEKSKNIARIDEIMAKEELTKRDAIRLARLMKKESEKDETKEKPGLEIVETYHVEKDDSATHFSSEYWELMRPNPLSVEEKESYRKTDSLMAVKSNKSDSSVVVCSDKEKPEILSKIIGEKKFNFKNDSISLRFSSLLSPHMFSFNAVEGFKYRQEFSYKQTLKNKNQLNYNGWIAYSFAMKNIQWNLHGKYQFAQLYRGVFEYSSGKNAVDYLGENAISPFVNAMSSLLFKENYARYYQQKYLRFSSEIEPLNGLVVKGGFDYSNRMHLQNNTDFSFFNRDLSYHENEILNTIGENIDLKNEISAVVNLSLKYTPFNYYKIKNGKKINVRSLWPTFNLEFSKGIIGLYSSTSDWTKISAGINHKINFGVGNELNYTINASKFLTSNEIGFVDYSAVNVGSVPVEIKGSPFEFKLLPYYVYNTNKQMLSVGINYKTPNLIIKYLPWISMRSWKENLHFNYLTMPNYKNYIEVGYSLSQFVFNSEIGVYSSFENGKYNKTGFRVIVRF